MTEKVTLRQAGMILLSLAPAPPRPLWDNWVSYHSAKKVTNVS